MASIRSITLAALVALLAILGGASARRLLTDSTEYSSPPIEDYSPPSPEYYSPPKEYHSPPKEYHSPPKEVYSPPEEVYYPPPTYSSPPPPEYDYKPPTQYSPPPPTYSSPPPPEYVYKPPTQYSPPPKKTYGTSYDYSCEEYAKECDFEFLNGGVPTFHLIGRGDNAYNPIIVDKYNYPTKVLNPNGECEVLSSDDSYDDCKNFFYFKGNRVATRTFNIRPVEEFKGKCIRLDITSAQLYDHTNLNPSDGNNKYPEHRRCVVFHTA